jgi:hypothetical protein
MVLDSSLIAAVLLLAASLHTARAGTGAYLRFAAILCAALALAWLAEPLLPGLAGAVALPVLPLAGAGLALSAIARCFKPVPALPATLTLMAALAGGILTVFGAGLLFALAPLLLGGLAVILAALHRAAFVLLLAGVLLMASAAALLARGVALPGAVLLAAALVGFAQRRVSSSRAGLIGAVP